MKPKYLTVSMLLVAALVIAAIWTWNFRPTHPTSGSPPPSVNDSDTSAISTWKKYQNSKYGFTVEYAPEYQIEARSLNGLPYDDEFLFSKRSEILLRLRVINLIRYLPTTNTPSVSEYVKTFRSFDKFSQVDIRGKTAYEYLSCGSATCSQQVVFIHENTLYDFSIEQQTAERAGIVFDNNQVIRTMIESMKFRAKP